jgi:hypothetical protein
MNIVEAITAEYVIGCPPNFTTAHPLPPDAVAYLEKIPGDWRVADMPPEYDPFDDSIIDDMEVIAAQELPPSPSAYERRSQWAFYKRSDGLFVLAYTEPFAPYTGVWCSFPLMRAT